MSRRFEADLAADDFDAAAATLSRARLTIGDADAVGLVTWAALPESLGLLAYAFVVDLISRTGDAFPHYAAASLLATSLCALPGAYDAALYHARQAATLDPDVADYHWFVTFVASSPDPNPDVARVAETEAVENLRRLAVDDDATRRKLRSHGYA